jgi:hypothetical protein
MTAPYDWEKDPEGWSSAATAESQRTRRFRCGWRFSQTAGTSTRLGRTAHASSVIPTPM